MLYFLIVLAIIEYYSVGIMLLARKKGEKNYLLNLIPFVSFFYVQKYTDGFKMLVVPVKKWGQTVIIFTVVASVFYLLGELAGGHFSPEQAGYVKNIVNIPITACILLFWFGLTFSTKRILEINNAEFPFMTLALLTVVPMPFLVLKGL